MNKTENILALVEAAHETTVHIHSAGEHVADEYLARNGIPHSKKKKHTKGLAPYFIYGVRTEFYPGFVTSCAPHVSTTGNPADSSSYSLDAGSALPTGTGAGDGP